MQSSSKRKHPEDIEGSDARSIHVELYENLFLSKLFLKVKLSAQIVLSGLRIDTNRFKALQAFVVRYIRRSVQYPGVYEDIMVGLVNIRTIEIYI